MQNSQDKRYKVLLTPDENYEVVETSPRGRRTLIRVRSTGDIKRDLTRLQLGVGALTS